MRVLVLNAGSSSLKWSVLQSDTESTIDQGALSWSTDDPAQHTGDVGKLLGRVPAFDCAGHRVVHGGTRFQAPAVITEAVHLDIEELIPLAPLHNSAALAGIDAVTQAYSGMTQVAAFDTAFHATLAADAYTYAVPHEWTTAWGIRRFGFHGLSVSYCATKVQELLGHPVQRLVVCHLGAGCSVTAVLNGKSIDTSMGYTPLDGVMMATRSGAIDPGIIDYVQRQRGLTAADVDRALNEQSGLYGVSGVSADLRQVTQAAATGNTQAHLAIDLFTRSIAKTIGSMITMLGGLDALVFTGGVGEHDAAIRSAIIKRFAYLGVAVSESANSAANADAVISTDESSAHVAVITAREDLSVLRAVMVVDGR